MIYLAILCVVAGLVAMMVEGVRLQTKIRELEEANENEGTGD